MVESVHVPQKDEQHGGGTLNNGWIIVVGSLNADLVQPANKLPIPGQTLRGGELTVVPGGKGANQACTVGRLGSRVAMIGNVGSDFFAGILLESLRSCGVDTTGVASVTGSSGAASVLVLPEGENGIIISPGANEKLTAQDVASRIKPFRAHVMLCQLEVPLEATEAALVEARRLGALTILDPAPAQPLPPELLRQVDYLTPNQSEALALLRREDSAIASVADAKSTAKELLSLGVANVILKLGDLGCVLANRDRLQYVPGFVVPAVDTTAAGDVFNGAFATALAEHRYPEDAAIFATAAAAISVTRHGAQSSIPSRSEVECFLQSVTSTATG